eukprot:1159919-Pelagomonas_calceolata.AAC.1
MHIQAVHLPTYVAKHVWCRVIATLASSKYQKYVTCKSLKDVASLSQACLNTHSAIPNSPPLSTPTTPRVHAHIHTHARTHTHTPVGVPPLRLAIAIGAVTPEGVMPCVCVGGSVMLGVAMCT